MPSDNNPFTITKRTASWADDCMMCRDRRVPTYAFPVGVFQLCLCRSCLALLRQAIEEMMTSK